MNSIKNYCRKFIKNESGFEMLQVGIVILIAVILGGVIWTMSETMKGGLDHANEEVDNLVNKMGGGKAGGSE